MHAQGYDSGVIRMTPRAMAGHPSTVITWNSLKSEALSAPKNSGAPARNRFVTSIADTESTRAIRPMIDAIPGNAASRAPTTRPCR